MSKYGSRWTDDEISFLIEKAGEMSIEQIAKKLGRPFSSTSAKADQYGVANGKSLSRLFTANQLAHVLGVASSTITRWTDEMELKFRWKRFRTTFKFKMIDIEDFFLWGEQHQELLDARKFKVSNFGNEPEWLRQKRKTDAALPAKHTKLWTQEEEARLITLYEGGVSKPEIAARLGRSESGIQRKLDRLKALGFLDIHLKGQFYTDTEKQKLLEYKAKGMTNREIGKKLRRSRTSISHQYNRLLKGGAAI